MNSERVVETAVGVNNSRRVRKKEREENRHPPHVWSPSAFSCGCTYVRHDVRMCEGKSVEGEHRRRVGVCQQRCLLYTSDAADE